MAFDQLSTSANSHIPLASRITPVTSFSGSHSDHQLHQSQTSLLSEMMYQQQNRVKRLLVEEDLHESSDRGCFEAQSCTSNIGMKNIEHELHERPWKTDKQGSVDKRIKKHRYAFQTRSHVDILDDGYRWRKYGQKSVKNNKFPRSYYRCTHQGCNVKKQIQRLSKDEQVVITTYEGVHSHPIQKSTDNFEHILTQMQIYNNTSASL